MVAGELAIRFRRAIEDVLRVDLFHPQRLCVTFVPEADRLDLGEAVPVVFGEVAEATDDGHVMQVSMAHACSPPSYG